MWIEVSSDVIHKKPEEKFYIGVDFGKNFSSGEYIDNTQVHVTAIEKGSGEDQSDYIVDQATVQVIDNTQTIVRVQNGEQGKWYVVRFSIVTTLGNEYVEDRELKII